LDIKEKKLLLKYLKKHFTKDKIKKLLEKYSLQKIRKLLAEHDIEYFALAYFGKYFFRPFGDFHIELMNELKFLIQKDGERLLYVIPRNHGKTQIVSFLFVLWLILYQKKQFIVLISASDELAISIMNDIKAELISNELIIEDFGNLKSPEKWSASEIWLTNNSCIMAKGILSTLRGIKWRGRRPEIVICDDILVDSMIESESKNEKVKNLFKEVVLNLGDSYTNYLVVGTTLSEDDLISELLKPETTGWRKIKKQAILSWAKREDLWDIWQNIYTDLSNENREQDAYSFFVANQKDMLQGAKVLWPDRWSYYDLIKKKIDDGDLAFWKELMNEPKSADEYIFQNLLYWDMLPDYSQLEIVMYIDPAVKSGRKNDFSAITILGMDRKTKQKYVLDGSVHKVLPDELFQIAIEKLQIFPVDRIGFETIQAQDYMKKKFEEALWEAKIYIPVIGVNSRANKHSRIVSLQPDIQAGYILFNFANRLYNNQIKDYSIKAKNDDAADSLYGAVELLGQYRSLKVLPTELLF
jgi:predicted phage terminase large subunit-like protein